MTDNTSVSKCAFLGLGNMGHPMAGHLVSAGHQVTVYNRTASKAQDWASQYGGSAAATPREAADGADFVAVCVGGDDDVRSVVFGADGALSTMRPGSVLVDHTTASAALARELAGACADRSVGFVDGPISGGQVGAENGTLSVMCGGKPAHFEAAREYIDAYAKTITLIGPAGSGQLTKMVNQILCLGAIQGASEAIAFGESAGLDMNKVLAAVTQGAAGSWYLSNRGETMVADEFDFGFAVDWLAKDLGLVAAEAESIGASTPLVKLGQDYLARCQAAGDNRMDATVMVRPYRVENQSAG